MEILDLLGYIGALMIGVVLGLIGGGGSILTVPVFVYLLSINPVTATAYSLFVVGTSSLVGSLNSIKRGLVDFRTAAVFSVPAFVAVYIARKYLVPAIPEHLFTVQGIEVTRNIGIMLFFAFIMVLASLSMIKKESGESLIKARGNLNYPLMVLEGFVVGIITGIVGAGGGFLIIPALVLLAKLPIKRAVATSLLIIAIKSLLGFLGDVQNREIDWSFLVLFTGLAVVGIFLGGYLNRLIDGRKLEKGFGWFVLAMGIYIIWKELF